jgi:phosphatidylglycerophosphatase A
MTYNLDSKKVAAATEAWIAQRGVTKEHIAELVLLLQKDYFPGLTMEHCIHNVEMVLMKREVQNAVLTGIQLDILAEEGKLLQPLQDMIQNDEGLYGCDEVLALSIVNVDKLKPGILKKLNMKGGPQCHTFLDDIVGAIAASASSRIAHNMQEQKEQDRADQAAQQQQ